MENIQLYQGLTFLAYATGVMIIIIGGMLVRVLFDLSKLTVTINETAVIIKNELEPTLKNISKSVEIVSGIIIKTDESINKIKDFIKKSPLNIFARLTSATGSLAKGFFSGLGSAFKMFCKK